MNNDKSNENVFGFQPDFNQSFELLLQGAELGDIGCIKNLAIWGYVGGHGTEKNLHTALEWLEKGITLLDTREGTKFTIG